MKTGMRRARVDREVLRAIPEFVVRELWYWLRHGHFRTDAR